MKLNRTFLLFITILLITIWMTAFIRMERPSTGVAVIYAKHLKSLSSSVNNLYTEINKLENSKKSINNLRTSFSNARVAFKRVEFLLEAVDSELVKKYINGAPLPSLEPKAPGPIIIEPEGFQVMEELIFSKDVFQQKEKLISLANKLRTYVTPLASTSSSPFTEVTILDASRSGLLRVASLGITGFDTPASDNAIHETESCLKSIHEAVACFYPFIPTNNTELKEKIEGSFINAISYLKANSNFETFDRMHFLREYINPLYGQLLDLHVVLGLEKPSEVRLGVPAVNYMERNIFSNDYLDIRFFTKYNSQSTNKGMVELGKLLFFDPVLSKNNQRSCASCHHPDKGFTDGLKTSTGFNFEKSLQRNSPTVLNTVYSNRFFYDMRADFLEKQMEHVVVDHLEFNSSYPEVFEKLKLSPEYITKFKEVFPEYKESYISRNTFASALTAYLTSLSGFNSEFDKYIRKEITEIDQDVISGFNLFMGKAGCGTCHFAPVFNGTRPPLYQDTESEVLGVPSNADLKYPIPDEDRGRAAGMLKESSPIYEKSFKTPTVRNIALTAPYMHNGVFNTLEEVMEFYNLGGGQGIGLDIPNQTLPSSKLNLSKKEMKDIIAFMHSLTDTTGLTSKPMRLPEFPKETNFNERKIGGVY